MIDKLNSLNKFDDIYIVGLSAGGAMASTMLVNYPDTFTAGAIVAGIPSPCADNLIKAISCMRSGPSQTSEQLTQQVKKLNTRQKTWPAISIWTGKQDKVVNPINSTLLAQHWVELTSSIKEPTTKQYSGYKISQWRDEKQQQNVELIEVENMTHGIAVTDVLPDGGTVGPFLIKAPISTMKYLVKKWQLTNKM
jgi:poly(3-hydroxybutyrate) depolymerase